MPFLTDDPDPAQPDEVKCDRCGMPTPRLDDPYPRPLCDTCYQEWRDDMAKRRLTRQERLQGLADRGVDTLEEHKCER